MPSSVRLPGDTHRLSVLGRTGTGKTQAGLWHLSLKKFTKFPWVIFDAKGDSLINEIARNPLVKRITLADTPDKKGLHHLRATPPEMESDAMEDFLWRIHARGKCGLFLDEGFVFDPRSKALRTVLTQGRSLRIPMIILSQRPAWMSRFVFSEADFFQVFGLNDQDDVKTVKRFVRGDVERRLPPYHSIWYDVGQDDAHLFLPVPPRDVILENFDQNLKPGKLVI